MNKKNTPWDEIKTPQNDLSVRKVRTNGLPLYWGTGQHSGHRHHLSTERLHGALCTNPKTTPCYVGCGW